LRLSARLSFCERFERANATGRHDENAYFLHTPPTQLNRRTLADVFGLTIQALNREPRTKPTTAERNPPCAVRRLQRRVMPSCGCPVFAVAEGVEKQHAKFH
jgi:hypothetical protein